MQASTAAGTRALRATALGQRIGIVLKSGSSITDRSQVVFALGMTSKDLASRIAAEADVEYAVPDERRYIVAAPNDPFYAARSYDSASAPTSGGPPVGQWYLKPAGPVGTAAKTAPSSINAEQAWDLATGSGTIVIADIDTGLRFDHPDLQGGNILPGYDMISADTDGSFTTANDGNGRDPDASDPGDWVTQTESNGTGRLHGCAVQNSSWHGTQTAGLMGAATNNGVGMASVGFGNVKVMPVRVVGKCGGFDSDIIAAMLWATGVSTPSDVQFAVPTRANVLNLSLGGAGACSAAYQDAITQVTAAGAVVVVAAGNGDANGVGTSVTTPASCNGVITVAALRSAGDKVGFSNLGPQVAISAPGGNCVNTAAGQPCLYPILTTFNAGTTTPVVGPAGGIYTDSYRPSLGTSFSTPLVAATAALMLSVRPALTPAQILAKLQASAQPFPTTGGSAGQATCAAPSTENSSEQGECYCVVGECGAGMLDAHAAVLAALGVQAAITLATTSPSAGVPVTLTSSSTAGSGGSITSYLWTMIDPGTTGATIVSGQGSASVTVLPTAAGSFTVSLVVSDAFGNTSTSTATVAVAPSSEASPAGSSSGGGAVGLGWLLLLLCSVVGLVVCARSGTHPSISD